MICTCGGSQPNKQDSTAYHVWLQWRSASQGHALLAACSCCPSRCTCASAPMSASSAAQPVGHTTCCQHGKDWDANLGEGTGVGGQRCTACTAAHTCSAEGRSRSHPHAAHAARRPEADQAVPGGGAHARVAGRHGRPEGGRQLRADHPAADAGARARRAAGGPAIEAAPKPWRLCCVAHPISHVLWYCIMRCRQPVAAGAPAHPRRIHGGRGLGAGTGPA